MYQIHETQFGFRLTFKGYRSEEETLAWLTESIAVLRGVTRKPFQVVVDMRHTSPMPPKALEELVKGQRLYKKNGMNRSAVLVPSPLVGAQLAEAAGTSGIGSNERYFNAADPQAEQQALDWVLNQKDNGVWVKG